MEIFAPEQAGYEYTLGNQMNQIKGRQRRKLTNASWW